ncbi:uncharacterized protein DS421_12g365920 [Arachis hypogaea]|nr:uncharacterized protein DS421_12g365920 [Arachis hypogaea]
MLRLASFGALLASGGDCWAASIITYTCSALIPGLTCCNTVLIKLVKPSNLEVKLF